MAASNAGKMMFQSTRLCWHHLLCRRLLTSSALSARSAVTAAAPATASSSSRVAINSRIHSVIPAACLHTHQRLQQDNTTTTSDSGSSGETDNSTPITPEHTDASTLIEDLDLGNALNVPVTSPNQLSFNGVAFEDLPIVTIKASWNNTIISITDHTGQILKTVSAGSVGLKNAKKGTSVAGQTIGAHAAKVALENGVKTVRVLIKGIGPGRQTSIRGLQVGGLEIVSITDRTGVPMNGDKPRKARRL